MQVGLAEISAETTILSGRLSSDEPKGTQRIQLPRGILLETLLNATLWTEPCAATLRQVPYIKAS